jgi:hypothetical protein
VVVVPAVSWVRRPAASYANLSVPPALVEVSWLRAFQV